MDIHDIRSVENRSFPSGLLDLRWRMTSLCNYQCDFCIQGDRAAHRKLAEKESPETRSAICQKLRAFLDSLTGFSSVKLSLTGGEISILPELPAVLETLSGSSFPGEIRFDITTNFSAPAERYAALFQIVKASDGRFGARRLHITASYYRAYVPAGAFMKKVREAAALVSGEPASGFSCRNLWRRLRGRNLEGFSLAVVVPIVTDADHRRYLSMKGRLLDVPVSVRPILIREHPTSVSAGIKNRILKSKRSVKSLLVTDSTGESMTFRSIQDLGAFVSEKGIFCPRGYTCDAGVRSMWINALGDVYRCPAIGSDMRLGSIPDNSFRLLTEPAVCTSGHCSCSQFHMIRKA